MSTIEQALQQAEQMAVATAAEEQEYQYSTQYLRRSQYVSDNTPIEIVNKEIQSMDSEISVKGESISQYIEFRTDRYQDGVDLLGMLFNVHYEKGTYGGENRPVNVRYNDTKMILGWAVPNAAVKESGILNMCIWATGNLYDDTYIWKTKPKSYVINDGLTIAENIAQPDDNWYVQFVNELETKIQEFSGRIDDIVQVEESLSTDVQVINEKYDSIIASAETAGQSAASAQTSEQNAQLYKEQTQQIAEQVKGETSKVYKYKGSVPTYDSLPTENVSNGDVYNVEYDGMNYAWDEANKKWDSLGIVIDLSKYSTTEQIELMLNQYVQKESGKGLFSGSYDDLSNKPRIGGTELAGDKTLDDFGIASKTALANLSESVATNADNITELNSNLTQQSTEAMDLKMLGWSVPKECPVQNYVDSDGVFHQRVGRVDLGSLNWKAYDSDRFITYNIKNAKPFDDSIKANAFCKIYKTVSKNNVASLNMSIGIDDAKNAWLRNDSYEDAAELKNSLQGVYLYYELETTITMTIDGNEAVTKVNESLEGQGLLNKFDGELLQGAYVSSNGSYDSTITTSVCTKNKIDVVAGDRISAMCNNKVVLYTNFRFYKTDGTFISGSNATNGLSVVVPANATKCSINFATESEAITPSTVGNISIYINNSIDSLKNDLSKQCKKDDITTNETLIGTFNGKNYYRKLFTGISGLGGSITVNVGEKIEIYNYYGRAYTYGQSGASDVKYPIPNKNYYIESQNSGETSFQLTIPTSSDTRKVDLVIEYTKVDE